MYSVQSTSPTTLSYLCTHLCGDADDAASRSRTRVTRLLGFLGVASAEVIGARVDDDCSLEIRGVSIALKFLWEICYSLFSLETDIGKRKQDKKVSVAVRRVETYAKNALLANQLDQLIADAALAVAAGVGLEVAEVADVADIVAWGAVGLAEGVEVGTGGGAAVGVVAELVDVHAALGVGVVAGDVPGDGRGRGFGGLIERYRSGDFGVASEFRNCCSGSCQ